MKKVIAIAVAALFVLSITGLTFAAEQKAAPAAPASKDAPVKVKHVTGTIGAVDAKAKTLTVKSKTGDVAFTMDDKVAKTLTGLKVGDKVAVKYSEKDGKNVAIAVHGKDVAEKMEKEAAPKAEEKKPAAPAPAEKKPAEKKTGGY